MSPVKGWDTVGTTAIGMQTDGRITLTFTGKDGLVRNIFVPGDSVGHLVMNLIAAQAEYEKHRGTKPGDAVPTSHLIGINGTEVGSDKTGREFSLGFQTKDGLTIRFHFDRNTIEGLTTALVATLSKHGTRIDLDRPEGQTH